MATSGFAAIGIAVLALSACDISQKKPETINAALPLATAITQAVPGGIRWAQPAPAQGVIQPPRVGGGDTEAAGSIRLYGPGVSRKRQTRV